MRKRQNPKMKVGLWNRKNKENKLKKQEPDQEPACQREIALAIVTISLFTFLHTSNPTKEAACTKEARKEKSEEFDPFR